MNNRGENRQNGFGRRHNENSGQNWRDRWSGPEENEPWGNSRRYGDPYGPDSPIDFDQNRGYYDPYRDYQDSPGGSEHRYSRRGDYRGNDPEFGYNEPGEPLGGSLYGPTWNQPRESRREAQESDYPIAESRHHSGYKPRRDNSEWQDHSGPDRSQGSQSTGRGWSRGYEGPGSYARERAFGYGGGSSGEQPENVPGLNRNRGYSEDSNQNTGWSSGNRPDRGGWNNEGSSWGQPWNDGPYTGRGPKGYQRPDDRIREDVCERLSYHGFIDPSEVDIEVEHGEVRLSGCCTSRREKKMIEDVVDSVRGVRDVNNNISIERSEQSGPGTSVRLSSSDEQSDGKEGRSTSRQKSSKSRETA